MKKSLLMLMCLLPLACQKTVTPDPVGSVSLYLEGDFGGIDSVYTGVTHAGDTTVLAASIGAGAVSGSLEDLPIGEGYTVFARLFDGMVLKYRGEARFDVRDDKPQALAIELLPVDMFWPPPYWPTYLTGISDSQKCLLTWDAYPDTAEFAELRMSYMIVMDTTSIGSDFDSRSLQYHQLQDTAWAMPWPDIQSAYFRVFLYSEKYRAYLPGGDRPIIVWRKL